MNRDSGQPQSTSLDKQIQSIGELADQIRTKLIALHPANLHEASEALARLAGSLRRISRVVAKREGEREWQLDVVSVVVDFGKKTASVRFTENVLPE